MSTIKCGDDREQLSSPLESTSHSEDVQESSDIRKKDLVSIKRVTRLEKYHNMVILKNSLAEDFNLHICQIFDFVLKFYRSELGTKEPLEHAEHLSKINKIKDLQKKSILMCKTNPLMPLETSYAYFVSYSDLISKKKIDEIISDFQFSMDEKFDTNEFLLGILHFIICEIRSLELRASQTQQDKIWRFMLLFTDLSLKYSLLKNSGYYKFLEIYNGYAKLVQGP